MELQHILVIAIAWIIYGILSAVQCYRTKENLIDLFWWIVFYITFAPLVLLFRILYGAFTPYTIRSEGEDYHKL